MKNLSYILNAILIIMLFFQCQKKKDVIVLERTVTKEVTDSIRVAPDTFYIASEPEIKYIEVVDQEVYDSLEAVYLDDIKRAENISGFYKMRFEALKAGGVGSTLELLPPYTYTSGVSILSNGIIDWNIKSIGTVDTVEFRLTTTNTHKETVIDNTKTKALGLSAGVSYPGSLQAPIKLIYKNGNTIIQGGVITGIEGGQYKVIGPTVEIGKLIEFGKKKRK